jgi:hypothetical protein
MPSWGGSTCRVLPPSAPADPGAASPARQEEFVKRECMEFDHRCREAIRRRLANLATCGCVQGPPGVSMLTRTNTQAHALYTAGRAVHLQIQRGMCMLMRLILASHMTAHTAHRQCWAAGSCHRGVGVWVHADTHASTGAQGTVLLPLQCTSVSHAEPAAGPWNTKPTQRGHMVLKLAPSCHEATYHVST